MLARAFCDYVWCKIAGIALHAGDVLADFFDCLVELFLASAGDEDMRAFLTNNLAVARAIPLVAPVMTATLFSNFIDMDKGSRL